MDPIKILAKYCKSNSKTFNILIKHGELVAKKALKVADKLKLNEENKQFLYEAAMLHDIGIIKTNSEWFGCSGDKDYLYHGVAGQKILEKEGFLKHAKVCETHLGTGITAKEVKEKNLPLPTKDMIPTTLAEEIIAYADKFYSKSKEGERTLEQIRANLLKIGQDHLDKFNEWNKKFS